MDRKQIQQKYGLIGESAGMVQLVDKVMQVAPTGITVLLQGESGVGKDVTARALHGLSKRKDRNLMIVNCGAIPEGIIESELFGHERGSFTGAEVSREGYFEKANGGTIFLDEIGDTPKSVQVKLLRILENGEYFRVGSADIRKTDVRIIAATNRDLWKDIENGTFREDLFYRLNTVTIRIPALRSVRKTSFPFSDSSFSIIRPSMIPSSRLFGRRAAASGGLPLARQYPRIAQCGRAAGRVGEITVHHGRQPSEVPQG